MPKKTPLTPKALGEIIYFGAKANNLDLSYLEEVKDISKISKYFEYACYGYYRLQPIHFAIEHNNIKLARLLTMLDPEGLTDSKVYHPSSFFPGSYTPCGLYYHNERYGLTTTDDSDRPRTHPLSYAIKLKRWELLIEMVSLYPFGGLGNILGYALIEAIRDNREDVVRFLLEAGANSEYYLSYDYGKVKKYPLYYAAESGNKNIIKMLIEHNPILVYKGNPTPLNSLAITSEIKNYITQLLLLSSEESIPIATPVNADLKQPSAPNDPISTAQLCSPEEDRETNLPVAQAEQSQIDMKLCRLRTLYNRQWNSAFFFAYSSKNMGERLRGFETYEEAETFIRDNPQCKRTKSIMEQIAEVSPTSPDFEPFSI